MKPSRLIKVHFSRSIKKGEVVNKSRQRKGERGIWQRRFWEHVIRNDIDYANHVDYIHYNPVKHGYVNRVIDWEYSSFHRWVKKGIYPSNWVAQDEVIKSSVLKVKDCWDCTLLHLSLRF